MCILDLRLDGCIWRLILMACGTFGDFRHDRHEGLRKTEVINQHEFTKTMKTLHQRCGLA